MRPGVRYIRHTANQSRQKSGEHAHSVSDVANEIWENWEVLSMAA